MNASSQVIESFTRKAVNKRQHKQLLLQYLYRIQRRFSCIPSESINTLSQLLDLPAAVISGVIDFYSFLHHQPRGTFDILFSDNITDRMQCNQQLLQQLCNLLGLKPGIPREDGRVSVATTSCTGMCDQGPALLVNGRAITNLDNERINTIAALVDNETPLQDWPEDFFQVAEGIRQAGPLLKKDLTPGDALKRWQALGSGAILDELDHADLRGRGGAGFKTASKWAFCKQANAEQRYVVCNADEGEPGTFKDRVLLQAYAHELIEGMTLCAAVIGASHGFIYLRGEYEYLFDALEKALEVQRKSGLLGSNLLGIEGLDFDIEIHLGAGAYICGEESALLESLEGKRGIPRIRPPFPVTHGYDGKPTVVNNVETFIAAAKIAAHTTSPDSGSHWFRQHGTDQSTGTKLLSISGDCAAPGIYEVDFGTPISEILSICGAHNSQAVQIAGAAGNLIPQSDFERTLSFQDLATGGSFMVFDASRDLSEVVHNFSQFFVHESCGFCTPCRVGGALLNDLVKKFCDGHASQYDLDEIRNIADLMKSGSHCGLGHTAPNAVLDYLDNFPQQVEQRLAAADFEPSFDLDRALSESRAITGRNDHLNETAEKPEPLT